ncbi:MAG: FecR family protein [Limisphaerales bacterium]
MTTKFFPLILGLAFPFALPAASLTEATFSQVIKDVSIVSMETRASAKARLGDAFKTPDVIRTGPDSLAELMASDKTVTRVGANTVFSFEKSGRAINLEQGSVLFHSPKGKGGGTIRTKGASAAVLGTTLMVTATVDGGFKAIMLEGRGQITLPNGNFRILTAGQVTFVLPGARSFGPQLNINLGKLVENSRLVQGFEQELPSKPSILEAIERQLHLIRTGEAEDTHQLVGNQATKDTLEIVDSSVLEQIVENRVDRLAVAKTTDVTITTSNLRDYPAHLFLSLVPADIPVRGVLSFSGFVGNNITIDTLALNFSPFLEQTDFVLGAQGTLTFQRAALALLAVADPGQTPLLREVTLLGKTDVVVPAGMSFGASGIGEFTLESGAVLSLQNVSFVNGDGKVDLDGHQALDLTGGGINAPTPAFLLEGGTVSLNGGTYSATGSAIVSAYGTTLNAIGTTVSGDTVRFEANTSADLHAVTASAGSSLTVTASQDVNVTGGSASVSGASGTLQVRAGRDLSVGSSAQFQANTIQMAAVNNAVLNNVQARAFNTLNVSADGNLTVAGGTFTGASGAPTVAASFSAGDTLTVNGPTIASVASISMSARTMNLSNVNFPGGSTVNLTSQFGLLAANPNTGAASVPGHVNFIINVNYNGNPAQLYVGNGINISTVGAR